jgi:hypothetical protein
MITLTPDYLDRIEVVRGATITAIKASTLPDEITIAMRQAINKAIDDTVQTILSEVAPPRTPTNSPNSNLLF